MSCFPCRHAYAEMPEPDERRAFSTVQVRRCLRHSREQKGISVWVWGTFARTAGACLCDVSDRFLVAVEDGAVRWRDSADVVIGRTRPTVRQALTGAGALLSEVPGCTLATVPAGKSETVFRTSSERVVLGRSFRAKSVCGVCVYPWLAAGYRLTELLASFR